MAVRSPGRFPRLSLSELPTRPRDPADSNSNSNMQTQERRAGGQAPSDFPTLSSTCQQQQKPRIALATTLLAALFVFLLSAAHCDATESVAATEEDKTSSAEAVAKEAAEATAAAEESEEKEEGERTQQQEAGLPFSLPRAVRGVREDADFALVDEEEEVLELDAAAGRRAAGAADADAAAKAALAPQAATAGATANAAVGGKPSRFIWNLTYTWPIEAPAPMAERRLQSKRQLRGRRLHKPNSHPCDLGNYDNVQYHLEIIVGAPCEGNVSQGQRFQVVPDTGSSDLWIPAENCSRCKSRTAKFVLAKSCTARILGERITFRYGDGTIAVGGSFLDWVQIGDLAVKDQFLIQVDRMESDTHMKSDGILGLAHHYVSDRGSRGRTFMSTLFEEHPQLPRMFSFYLTGNTERPSSLVFGDADLVQHSKENEFKYGKGYYMTHTDLWLTSVWSIGWSGTGVEMAFPDRGTLGSPALIDSGSSLIVLAPDIYDHLLSELQWRFTNCRELSEQQIVTCDCPPANDLSRIPSLVINIIDENDQQFSLCMSPDEYILESMDPMNGRSTCVPALQRGSSSQPVPLIFGMTFMRSFYTNFDIGNNRIGFARSNMSPLPPNAKCTVDAAPLLRRAIWVVSVVVTIFSVIFACYVLFAPKGCCHWLCCCGKDEGDGDKTRNPL